MYLKKIEMDRWNKSKKPEIECQYDHNGGTISIDLNEQEVAEIATICAKAMVRELSEAIKVPEPAPASTED
jgi:hypothetical protein